MRFLAIIFSKIGRKTDSNRQLKRQPQRLHKQPEKRPKTNAHSSSLFPQIAHPVRRLKKLFVEPSAQFSIDTGLAHGLVHAGQPLVAFADADLERHVPRTQHGVNRGLDSDIP
jgi:hypothetical protein